MTITPSPVQFTRLTVLADYVAQQVERKNFSMKRWGITLIGRIPTTDDPSCKTTACAGGWACMVPTFQKEGLSMGLDGPKYGNLEGHAALREFFGLDSKQEEFLFDSFEAGGYTPLVLTPKQWSKRCRTFLKSL